MGRIQADKQQPARTLREVEAGFSAPGSNERGVWLPNMAAHTIFYVVRAAANGGAGRNAFFQL